MNTKEDIYQEYFWEKDLSLKDLQILDKKKADWNKTNNNGYLPLHLALMGTKNEELIEFVLDKTDNAHIHTTVSRHFHWNCLFFALHYDQSLNIFKKLIERGANYKQLDEDGDTLLVQARKNKKILQYIQQLESSSSAESKSIENNGQNSDQQSKALSEALWDTSDTEVFELLLQSGASLDYVDEDGNNLLFSAIGGENVKAVTFLLERGNKEIFNKPNHEGETVHGYLAKAGNNKALQLIRELVAKEYQVNATLAHNLKIVPKDGQTDNSKEIPTWETLPAFISNFPFTDDDEFELIYKGNKKRVDLGISDEDENFDTRRVERLVGEFIKQTHKVEQKLYDFALECFEAVDWELKEKIPCITDDPNIINADEKTQFLYMMNITGAKGIINRHNTINFYLDIDDEEQYSLSVTFYSEWEEEHGCMFLLEEGEELVCESLDY